MGQEREDALVVPVAAKLRVLAPRRRRVVDELELAHPGLPLGDEVANARVAA